MGTHKDLDVWHEAIDFVVLVYTVTASFPQHELYGLSAQMRRAAVSIPSNIAEGAARRSNKEYAHFISIALGSLAELETQLIIAQRLGYCADQKMWDVLELIRPKLIKLFKYLKEK